MNIVPPVRFALLALLSLQTPLALTAEDHFSDARTEAIKAFLLESFGNKETDMVIGLLGERGSWIISAGKLDNGTNQEVNGDTLFEIGSVTKTFTALLALEMARRGELKLEDPVARYLPASVKVPVCNGKPITILNLAAQDSGLPFNADNLSGKDWKERFDSYSVEQLYSFLSGHTLKSEPGATFQYSNLGMTLLGHVMELRSGASFESLVVNRICRPLGMNSTRVTLTPEMASRMATGHDEDGKRAPAFDLKVMAGAGALRSTANDLLKYVSAHLGLTPSDLTPLMKEMQAVRHRDSPEFGKTAMPWWYGDGIHNPAGSELLGHGGGTGGASAFIGLDLEQRRGVVVLADQVAALARPYWIGWRLLQGAPLKGVDIATIEPIREYTGSGMALASDKESGALRITKVYANTPASEAGLSAGLVIQKINDVTTSGKDLGQCMDLIRGPAGKRVRLELIDPEGDQVRTVELTLRKFLTSS